METISKLFRLKFLNTIDLMPPMKHRGKNKFFLRRCFTESPYHRALPQTTNLVWKMKTEKKYSLVIALQQIYSRTKTDTDSR